MVIAAVSASFLSGKQYVVLANSRNSNDEECEKRDLPSNRGIRSVSLLGQCLYSSRATMAVTPRESSRVKGKDKSSVLGLFLGEGNTKLFGFYKNQRFTKNQRSQFQVLFASPKARQLWALSTISGGSLHEELPCEEKERTKPYSLTRSPNDLTEYSSEKPWALIHFCFLATAQHKKFTPLSGRSSYSYFSPNIIVFACSCSRHEYHHVECGREWRIAKFSHESEKEGLF